MRLDILRRRHSAARRACPRPAGDPTPHRLVGWRKRGLALLATGLLVLFGPVAAALWSVATPDEDLGLTTAVVGFAVSYDDQTDRATGVGDTVGFDLGPTEAAALLAAPDDALALPFAVVATTSGVYGLSYEVAPPQFAEDSVLARSTFTFFPSDAAGCTVAAAADPPTPTTDAAGHVLAVAPPTGPFPPRATVTQPWCLVVSYSPNTYATTTTVTGQNTLGSDLSPATADWTVGLDPDPAQQPPASVSLTHYLVRQ